MTEFNSIAALSDYLNATLKQFGSENSVASAIQLDGVLTAVVSGPRAVMPHRWLGHIWGGEDDQPQWSDGQEAERFYAACLQRINATAKTLQEAPQQFQPLYAAQNGAEPDVADVVQWCRGYMLGVQMGGDWDKLPDKQQVRLALISLFGLDDYAERRATLTEQEVAASLRLIQPAAVSLHGYWKANRADLPAAE